MFWRNAQKGGIFLRVRFDLVIEFYGPSSHYASCISPTSGSAEQTTLAHAKESIFPSQGLSISNVSSRHGSKKEAEAREATRCTAILPLMTEYRDIILRKAIFQALLNHARTNNGTWMTHVYRNVFLLCRTIVWYRLRFKLLAD